jgi:omega-hydroxy-beta-dihydromenaquinone-9 sulfotransferase
MISIKPAPSATVGSGQNRKWWQPNLWAGCGFPAWVQLLVRHRFAIHWSCWVPAIMITILSLIHTALGGLQELIYGRRIRRTRIRHAPIFIIGHWRSGTTLLHELLSLDERHTSPTTYACIAPNHFLLTESIFTRWLWFLSPQCRPMDNMPAGFDRPQEDEFALCMLGQPSPYWTIAFPNRSPQGDEYLDLERLSPRQLSAWKRTFRRFLTELTYRDERRLVLKSPTHSCRIKTLLELFPDARFVHLVRDPYAVYSSTLRLWRSLYHEHALQKPTFAGLEERVLAGFVRMDHKIETGRKLIHPDRYHLLRYEDLVENPLKSMRELYSNLGLNDFDRLLPQLSRHLASIADYRTNRYQLTESERAMITRRWGRIISRFGYDRSPPVAEIPCRTVFINSRAETSLPAVS